MNLFLICFIKRTKLQDPFINGRQKLLRQHTTSANKNKYFDGTFSVIIFEIIL